MGTAHAQEASLSERTLAAVERARAQAWAYALLVVVWILLRNLLEGVLEPPHQMGFDWRGEISFPMFFLHFPLFYIGLYLFLTLWLHLISGRRIAEVARAVTLGFSVILLAPILDSLISRGVGYDLKYLAGMGAAAWRFWDLGGSAGVVSPGQRIEIALAVALCGAYVFLVRAGSRSDTPQRPARWRAGVWALVAALGAYAIMAFLGAWPSLFARVTLPGALDLRAAYVRVYQLQGLVADESRRHALVIALLVLPALALAIARGGAHTAGPLLRRISWTRLAHYTGMAPAGVVVGYLLYHEFLPGAFANPIDLVAGVMLWLAVVAAFGAALVWNDLNDRDADRLNAPERPLVSGALSEHTARGVATGLAAGALLLALCVGYAPFLLMIACLALAWLYSSPPLRLKRWPLLATLVLAFLSVISLAIGFSLFAQEMTLRVLPRGLAGALMAGIALGFTAKDLRDAEGDLQARVGTLATLLPAHTARRLTAALVALGFALAPLFLRLGALYVAIALLCAGAGTLLTLRRARPDTALLVLFLAFSGFTLVCLAQRPAVLRERVPDALLELHANALRIDGDVRVIRRAREARGGEAGTALRDAMALTAEATLHDIGRAFAQAPARGGGAWGERLRWARAQIAPAPVAEGDLAALVRARPLHGGYLEAQLVATRAAHAVKDAIARADCALDRGVRPGDFLRHRAALTLAAGATDRADVASEHDRVAAITRDLSGAFLFGQDERTLWILTGDLTLQRGRPELAGESYTQALRRDAASADAWSGLGQARHATGDLAGALSALDTAQRLAPEDPWILNNRGVVERDLGRLDAACAAFETAARIAPELYAPAANLARTLERLGRVDEARAWRERAALLEGPRSP